MERFSPVFYDRDSYPVRYIRPESSYSYIYPNEVDLEKIAYFFDYELERTLSDELYTELGEQISRWRNEWWAETSVPQLTFWYGRDCLVIEDKRDRTVTRTYSFDGLEGRVYLACSDKPDSIAGLTRRFGSSALVPEIEAAIDEFCGAGLMMRDGLLYLSLALPAIRNR
jgi:hypothetical protein